MVQPSHFLFCPYDGEKLVVDDDGQMNHAFCRACGFVDYQNPRPCVAILILRDDRILLARRGIPPAQGAWDIPGGFVDAEESAEDAVLREALEETTLHVEIREYLGSVPDVYDSRRTPTLNLCFWVEVIDGVPKPRSDVEALEWLPLDSLPTALAFPHQTRAFSMLKKRLKLAGV
jgi:ADP-ribose pyrophosphatase YjhB (NUDIX family)